MIRAGPSEAVRTMQEEHWGRGSSSGGGSGSKMEQTQQVDFPLHRAEARCEVDGGGAALSK